MSATSPAPIFSRRSRLPRDIALNIGSGTETSLLDLARLLSRVMGRADLAPVQPAGALGEPGSEASGGRNSGS